MIHTMVYSLYPQKRRRTVWGGGVSTGGGVDTAGGGVTGGGVSFPSVGNGVIGGGVVTTSGGLVVVVSTGAGVAGGGVAASAGAGVSGIGGKVGGRGAGPVGDNVLFVPASTPTATRRGAREKMENLMLFISICFLSVTGVFNC